MSQIPLKSLQPWNPFENQVWDGMETPITRQEIDNAKNNRETTEIQHKDFQKHSREFHIQRVTHFVLHGWKDPIQIDVGIPSLGVHIDWIITEGNHRLAAAFYLTDKTIEAEVSGSLDHAKTLLKYEP